MKRWFIHFTRADMDGEHTGGIEADTAEEAARLFRESRPALKIEVTEVSRVSLATQHTLLSSKHHLGNQP